MDNPKQVFLKLKSKIALKRGDPIFIKDLVEIYADQKIKDALENKVYPLNTDNESNILISSLSIISFIKQHVANMDLEIIGDNDILVMIKGKEEGEDRYKLARLIFVCFLLFIGSITAIINFHSDVDMRTTHRIIYKAITGIETDRPLLIQIPYSLGIGAGMSVFFNHIFKRKINSEPSPLELEIYSYQQSIDEYIKNNNTKQY